MASRESPKQITTLDEAAAFFSGLAQEREEVGAFVYLGRDRRILGVRHVRDGLHDRLQLPLRSIVRDALAFEAAGLVMAHNHPSGDPMPSLADRYTTGMLTRVLDPLGIRLLDHLVIAQTGASSFRALGWL